MGHGFLWLVTGPAPMSSGGISEFVFGLTTGALVAAFGVGLRIAWEARTAARERRQRDAAVISALKAEAERNLTLIAANLALLRRDLEALEERGTNLLDPLSPVENASYDLLRLTPPQRLAKDPDRLIRLWQVSATASYVNRLVEVREQFRSVNTVWRGQVLEGYKIYDRLLAQELERLRDRLATVPHELAA